MFTQIHSPTPTSLEQSCHDAFTFVSSLVKNDIGNEYLTFFSKNDFSRNDNNHWKNRWHTFKVYGAKTWFALFMFSILIMKEATKEKPVYLNLFLPCIFISYLLNRYQYYFGAMPFEYIGTKLLLNKSNSEFRDKERKHTMTCLQAKRMHPYSSLLFFSSTPLSQSNEIDFLEYDAIMRGLFGLKNKSFDCVSISALVMLKLIEQQIPASIMRVRPDDTGGNPSIKSHHYVLVNFSSGCKLRDVTTWNDDAILIDPWYGICISAKEIKENKENFFNLYPLLDPSDKVVSTRVQGDTHSAGYQFAIDRFKELREGYAERVEYSPSHIDMIYPRLTR